jgi:hypothetical protein
MKNILTTIKRITKRDKREWYTAEMVTVKGTNYEVSIKANNEEEACEFILHDAPKGNRLLSIGKEV